MHKSPRRWGFGLIARGVLAAPIALLGAPFALLAAPIALLGAPVAHAGTLIALQLSDLVAQSDLIVVARAQSESSRYQQGLIVSDVSLHVITSLKGASKPGSDLVVTHLGGSVGQVGLQVPGAAHFDLGVNVLVFLRRSAQGDLNVTGMSQGVLPIDSSGPTAQVTMGSGDAALMQRDDNGAFRPAPKQVTQRPLDSVMSEIQQLLP